MSEIPNNQLMGSWTSRKRLKEFVKYHKFIIDWKELLWLGFFWFIGHCVNYETQFLAPVSYYLYYKHKIKFKLTRSYAALHFISLRRKSFFNYLLLKKSWFNAVSFNCKALIQEILSMALSQITIKIKLWTDGCVSYIIRTSVLNILKKLDHSAIPFQNRNPYLVVFVSSFSLTLEMQHNRTQRNSKQSMQCNVTQYNIQYNTKQYNAMQDIMRYNTINTKA